MLRIKLVKIGKKDRPTWRVVVVEKARTGRGAVNDYIGSYNPHLKPKEFKLDLEKYTDWVKKGAQPTDTVKRLKGRFIDKTKEYQKEVGVKLYKSKKPEEEKAAPAAPKADNSASEAPTQDTGAEEKKAEEAVESTPEEPKEEGVSEEEKKEETIDSAE